MSFSNFFFHILFYRVVLFLNYLIVLPYLEILILLSILWRHFPSQKNSKIEKQKNMRFFGIQSATILQSLSSSE